jgi:hypothetical protein
MKKFIKALLVKLFGRTILIKLQRLAFKVLSLKFYKIKNHQKQAIKKVGISGRHISCGYYDIQVFNSDSSFMLVNSTSTDFLDSKLCLVNMKENCSISVVADSTISKQMGCRSQWLSNDSFLFNAYDNVHGNHGLHVHSINGSSRPLRYPIYDISENADMYVSLNFYSLELHRPGYGFIKKKSNNRESFSILGHSELVFSSFSDDKEIIKIDICKELGCSDTEGHYVNHLKFSPDGKYCIVFHLEPNKNCLSDYAKCILIDTSSWEVTCIPLGGRVSHYCWDSNNSLVLTYLGSEGAYYSFHKVKNGLNYSSHEIKVKSDGHPSWLNTNEILTDTYPDKYGYQHLFKMNIVDGSQSLILSIDSDVPDSMDERCDLHPRYCKKSNQIVIDTDGFNSERQVLIIPYKSNKASSHV